MTDPFFFGYGSLVHTSTHDYPDVERRTLPGWRREWCATTLRDIAFLSVKPCSETKIEGLIARVPNADWDALDLRETGYARHDVSGQIESDVGVSADIQVYAVSRQNHSDVGPQKLLLSYVDVVVQGYLNEFGLDGVTRFFQTTDGWKTKVLNDRANPRYPRHQTLDDDERALVDTHLREFGAKIVPVA